MRLFVLEPEEIPVLLKTMESEQRAIIDQIIEIGWYMRGGVGREEAWTLSPYERSKIVKMIDKKIESINKTGIAIL